MGMGYGPLQLVTIGIHNWRKSSRRDWSAAVDCHRVHAPRQGDLHIRCVLDDLLHRRHSLRLFFFAVLPVCVHVCDSVTVLGRARRRLDDHGNDDDLTPNTTSILPAHPPLRPRLVLVPPWVTIEFGPSPASSQPNPGSTFGFHHTLSLTRTLYTPSLPICLRARSRISAALFTPYTLATPSIFPFCSTALFFRTTRLTAQPLLGHKSKLLRGKLGLTPAWNINSDTHQQRRQHAQPTRTTTFLLPGCSST